MRFDYWKTGFLAFTLAMIPLGSAVAQSGSPVLERIAEDGVINIGHRESSVPFAYIGNDGEPVGFSIDLCMNIVDSVEEAIGEEVEVNWVAVNPQTRIPLMANGTIDLECGSTTNKLSRQEQVDYAYTTYITGTKILTKDGSGIEGVDGLAGKAIALAQGTTNEKAVQQAIEERNIEDVSIQYVRDHSEGFLALETDRVDAYSTDDVLLYGLIEKARNPEDYEVVGEFLSYDPYGLMVPKDDSDYRLLVNRTLVDLFRSGEFHEIYDEWFEPLGIPMSSMLETAVDIQTYPE